MIKNKATVGPLPKTGSGYITKKRAFGKCNHKTSVDRTSSFKAGIPPAQNLRQHPSYPANSIAGKDKARHGGVAS